MAKSRTVRLRILIPFILSLFMGLAILLATFQQSTDIRDDVVRNGMETVNAIMIPLQKNLSNSMIAHDIPAAKRAMAATGLSAKIGVLLLTDGRHTILLANRSDLPGKQAAAASNYSDPIAADIAANNHRVLVDRRGVRLSGYYTVALPLVKGEGTGTLYVEYDLSRQIAAERTSDYKNAAKISAAACLLAIALGALLHLLVTRRVERLAIVAEELSGGNLAARSGIRGWDELAQLANNFDKMAQQLAEDNLALRSSEERFRTIFDSVNDGIVIHDPLSGAILDVNQRMCEMFGYSRKEACRPGFAPLDFASSPLAGGEYTLARLQKAAAGEPQLFEWQARDRAGRSFWGEVTLLRFAAGGEELLLANVRDITSRKLVEEERAGMLNILGKSLNEIYTFDPATLRFTFVNDFARENLGFTLEEMYRLTPVDIKPEYNEASFRAAIQPLLGDTRKKLISQTIHQRANGSCYPVEVHLQLVEAGQQQMFLAVVIDITERLQAEMELQQARDSLSDIINSMPAILLGIDHDGTITQWNREAERSTGIPAKSAVGRHLKDVLTEFYPVIEAMHGEADLHRPAVREKILIEREGERHYFDLMLYTLAARGIAEAAVRIEEVTERVRINELMVQTEKMMSVGGLAAGMAHEINNPLGIIAQAAQNIERRTFGELPANKEVATALGIDLATIQAYLERRQVNQFLSHIREATTRAAKIVASLLQFSRRSESAIRESSLGELLDQTLELAASDYDLKKKYDFRSIEIIRDYAADLPPVPMMTGDIEQVILNLLKNAAQAMTANPPGKKPQITLRLHKDGKYILLEIVDNGPGMPENVRRRVFEPFFTTKEPGTGTGLGLSVAYMIVTSNHKGLIEVDSVPGSGTRFSVRLPIRNAPAEQ